jgi:hypothetical protein
MPVVYHLSSDMLFELVALLLYIQEVSSENSARRPAVVVFPSLSRHMLGYYLKLGTAGYLYILS